jgi:hypothetical protein
MTLTTSSHHPEATDLLCIKANVMIDQNCDARLADFGLLTFNSDPSNGIGLNSTRSDGVVRWMSPELIYPWGSGSEWSRPTEKSDCYALGMVILEVLSGEPPFPRDWDILVRQKVIEGKHPERPMRTQFTSKLWDTTEKCWSLRQNDRPTIESVLDHLGRAWLYWRTHTPGPPILSKQVEIGTPNKRTRRPQYDTRGSTNLLSGPQQQLRQLPQESGTSRTEQQEVPEVVKFYPESKGEAWERQGGELKDAPLFAQQRPPERRPSSRGALSPGSNAPAEGYRRASWLLRG